MARGPDIRVLVGCLPVIVFFAIAIWGFNRWVLNPRIEAQRKKDPVAVKERAAIKSVTADLRLDARDTGRVHVMGTLVNASPYTLKHVFANVTFASARGRRTVSLNLGGIGAGQTREVHTRLPGVQGRDVDPSGAVAVTVTEVRLEN